jgi:pantothenate synthetase
VISRRIEAVLRKIPGVKIDYVAVVNPETLEPLEPVRPPAAILAAVWIQGVRLIDGCLVPGKRG